MFLGSVDAVSSSRPCLAFAPGRVAVKGGALAPARSALPLRAARPGARMGGLGWYAGGIKSRPASSIYII
jgi:hypothetical protein